MRAGWKEWGGCLIEGEGRKVARWGGVGQGGGWKVLCVSWMKLHLFHEATGTIVFHENETQMGACFMKHNAS